MKFALALAAVASLSVSTQAVAQSTVTRSFTGTAVFTDGGPITNVGFTFGITYNPTGGNFFSKPVDYYTTTSSYASFNDAPYTFALQGSSIYIDGNGFGLDSTRPDFELGLVQYGVGSTPLIGFSVRYTDLSLNGHFSGYPNAQVVETTATGAVPEPATWAMMIAGFGMAGYALRRQKRAAFRFA